jgi:hypothetical protein
MSRFAFCSYCGRPPEGKWAEREHRVCRRCDLGVVLRTDADLHTLGLPWQPFMIVDREFTVQGISHVAEAALDVEEVDVIGRRLDQVLIEGEERADDSFELRKPSAPASRFTARVHSCGTPRAALVVLEPMSPAGEEPRPISAHDRRVSALYGDARLSA